MKKLIAVSVWAAVLSGLIFYLAAHWQEISRLLRLSIAEIILLAFLFVITQLLNGFRMKFLVEKVGLRLNLEECFNLANLNTMINYLPLKGGLLAVAFYFKNRYELSYTNFASITLASHLVQFSAVTFSAVLFLIIHYLITGIFLAKFFYIFALLFAGALLCILLVKNMAIVVSRWERVKKAVSGLNIILSDWSILLKLLCINFLVILIMGARFFLCFRLLSFKGPLILSLLAGAAKIIAVELSLIPAGLGIAELFAGGISEMMNSGINIGVYAALLDRVVSVLALIFMGSFSFVYFYRHKKMPFING